jgi:hypothetical protein
LIEDKLSIRQIAAKFSISDSNIVRHRDSHLPTALTKAASRRRNRKSDTLLDVAIAHKVHRLETQQEVVDRLLALIEARAKAARDDPDAAPGAETGLMAKELKTLGSGELQQIIAEWKVDAPALRELRELLELAGKETSESGGGPAGPMVVVVQVPPTTVEPVTIEVLGRRPTAADQIAPPQTVDALPEPDLDLDELRDETPAAPPKPESYF